MFKSTLGQVYRGLFDSFQGFWVCTKLNRKYSFPLSQQKSNEKDDLLPSSSLAQEKSSKESTESRPILTTLELRRREKALASEKVKKQHQGSAGPSASSAPVREKTAANVRVLQCILLNVFCVVALFIVRTVFNFTFNFLSRFASNNGSDMSGYLPTLLTLLMNALWVLPIFIMTRLVNALWFQDIASAALRYRGREPVQRSLSRGAADFAMALLLETAFLLQASLVKYLVPVPYIGTVLTYAHMSLLYSLYSFEYYWMSLGVDLTCRLQKIESDWPYYLGFGFPLTLVTLYFDNWTISGCCFGALFPPLIVSSFIAKDNQASKLIPPDQKLVLRVFAPSLYLCNKISLWFTSWALNI